MISWSKQKKDTFIFEIFSLGQYNLAWLTVARRTPSHDQRTLHLDSAILSLITGLSKLESVLFHISKRNNEGQKKDDL